MSNIAITKQPAYITLFKKAMTESFQSLKMAAKIYCDALKTDKNARAEFEKYFPNNSNFFNRLERFNAGQITQEFFFLTGAIGEKLRRLTVDNQESFHKKGAELLVYKNGEKDILKVFPNTVTELQTRQLVSPDGKLRTIPEQKAWIESQKTRHIIRNERLQNVVIEAAPKKQNAVIKQTEKPVFSKYEIKDGCLYVTGNLKFTVDELWGILRRMA